MGKKQYAYPHTAIHKLKTAYVLLMIPLGFLSKVNIPNTVAIIPFINPLKA
jgi:hypothetical protein